MLIEPLERRLHLAAQAYDWRNVAIKGTGFINGVVFSRAQQNLVYVNTDMGGAYRWDQAAAKWVNLTDWATATDWSLNYMGAESLAADPLDPSRVYLAMGTSYNFGGNDSAILRSTDQGRTWLRTNVSFPINGNGPGRSGAQRLQVDPNATNVLYYGTRTAGIWKSSDYGATWSKLNGYTFTTDASGVAQNVGTLWTLIDQSSSVPGNPSPVLYAAASTTGNAKIYRSLDAGNTWSAIPGQPTGGDLFPLGAALSADGNTLYLTYGVGDVGPNGVTNGSVYKVLNPDAAAPTWNALTIDTPHGQGGWGSVTIDPSDPNRLYVSTIDRWWPAPFEQLYRSTNGGSSWIALDPGYHRDDSATGWSATANLHWMLDVEVDPFNPNHMMFTTGFGLFNSTNATAATPMWSFFNDGLEQSAVLELASPNTGPVNLLSAIGDQNGFRHADFNVSPPKLGQANGIHVGTAEDIDVAWTNANYLVRLTTTAPYVQYSNDNGVNWAWMPAGGLASSTGGNLAISADGTRIVYEQGGGAQVVYSTRTGSAWSNWTTPSTNRPPNGAKIVADLVAAQTFYAYTGTTLSRSTDGGANWTITTTTAPAGGQWIRAVPNNAGHLLLSAGNNGLWRSTNGGANWTRINSGAVTVANEVGVGAAAPGQSYPAMFVGGTVNGQLGFHRSDDQGATWTMISDTSHQYGDVIIIQGDPRVFGRLYVGTNGRGVLYADIHNPPPSLPAGWATQNVGTVGSAGAAGMSGGAWEVIGGGSGVGAGATSDNFRFAYTQLTGDGTITARVTGVPLASPANNNAKAGVMIRESLAANSRSAFVALTPGSASGVVFQGRATTGGATTTAGSHTIGVWPPYWVRLVRAGNAFTAYRSADGISWTPLGTPQTLPMGATVQIGLAATSSDNNQLNIAAFDNVTLTAAPANLIITPITPDPRQSNVSTMIFTFDRPVSFALDDIDATRAGQIVELAGASLTSANGGTVWTLANLAALTDRAGNYTVSVATAGGAPLVSPASESWVMNLLAGGAGDEEMRLAATAVSVDYFRNGAYQYSVNPALLGGAPLLIDGGGGTDAFVLDGAAVALTLASTQKLSSLSIVNGAALDVRDHDIILDYEPGTTSPAGTWNGSVYTGVAGLVAAAQNFNEWDGPGLRTSMPAAKQGLTTLGVGESRDVLFLSGAETATWDGIVVDASSVIVKYTYAGDVNLDGLVDGADYGTLDNWIQFPGATDYFNGDVNYDGVIDGADYGTLDNSIQLQGEPL